DHDVIDEGPRGIVNEHARGCEAFEAFEAQPRRILPRDPAGHGWQQVKSSHCRLVEVLVCRVIDHAHAIDAWMADQPLEGMREQRFSAEASVLLGSFASEASAAAGCHDQGDACRHGAKLAQAGPWWQGAWPARLDVSQRRPIAIIVRCDIMCPNYKQNR